MEQQGIYERLKERAGRLKAESRDPFFTEYLGKFDQRLIQEKYQLDLLEQELENRCRMYEQRMASASAVPQTQTQAAPQIMPQAQTQAAPQTQTQAAPQIMPQTQTQVAPQIMPQAETQATPQIMPQTTTQIPPRPYMPQAAPRPQKNHEFTIGINVFGTIGVLFVLAALILLGINYMGSLVRELGLYVAGLLVWGIAEFVLKKKSQTLSMIFASLGIGCLYVTTMVNYLYLHNFNALATILITTGITVVVMLVSRRKDAGILRIICIGACMVSFLTMDTLHMVSDMELLIYMVMI
ncbi:MAG: hypothetical protein K2K19_09775, partial [Acetatifactor sp.]|nr:hypothetical protein [Acetatifactor sp.]